MDVFNKEFGLHSVTLVFVLLFREATFLSYAQYSNAMAYSSSVLCSKC